MRTAITVGIKKDGTAEIITGPEVTVAKHRAALNELKAGKDGYQEIQYWESGRGMRKIRSANGESGVNFNAAHPVEDQRKKNLPDLTPEIGENGVVNFNAAHQVEHQQDPKKAAKLKDLTPVESDAPGKVNFESSKLIVDDSKKTSVGVKANLPDEDEDDDLNDLTIEELKSLGEEEAIDLTGCTVKQDYIDRIQAFRDLDSENTVDQLKDLAVKEGVDVTGAKVKADYLNSITAARRSKS